MQYIYDLIDPETMKIRYVGKTGNLKRRLVAHCRPKQDKNHRGYWLLSLRDRGLKPIVSNIEAVSGSDREVFQAEIERIASYRARGEDLVNETNGGEGTTGYVLSEEHKQKISQANKGWIPSEEWRRVHSEFARGRKPMLGKKHSDETKRKIGQSNKGRKMTNDTIAKLSKMRLGVLNCNFGKPMPEEQKKKISEANKGKVISEEHKRKISEANKGRRSPMAGKKHSEDARSKLRAAWVLRRMRGAFGWVKTRKHSEATKQKLRAAWVRRKQKARHCDAGGKVEP